MTAASLSLVEPDMEISPIRLSPGSSLPESIHNACCLAFCPSFCLSSRTLFCRRSFHFNQLRSLLTRHDPGQGSLAPSRLDRDFPATMNPSDTAVRPRRRLWLPVRGCPLRTPNRVSQVPGGSFCARCLLSPRGVRSVPTVVASQSGAGFTSFGRLATPIVCHEAEPSSLDATARAFASPSLSVQGRPRSLRVRLHDFRPIIMINSFHLTRTSQASLGAFRNTRKKQRRGKGGPHQSGPKRCSRVGVP